jgi:hypothetical protein
VSSGSVRRSRTFGALSPRSPGRRSRHAPRVKPAVRRPVGSVRRTEAPRATSRPAPATDAADVLTRHGEQVEGDEPEPVGRGTLAGEHGADDRGEVLCRLTVALSDGNKLAVERRARGNVSERREQRSQLAGEAGAMARPGAYLPLGADIAARSCSSRSPGARPSAPATLAGSNGPRERYRSSGPSCTRSHAASSNPSTSCLCLRRPVCSPLIAAQLRPVLCTSNPLTPSRAALGRLWRVTLAILRRSSTPSQQGRRPGRSERLSVSA